MSATAGGVRLSRLAVADVPAGPRIRARSGDFLLESALVRAVVADVGTLRESGSIVDAVSGPFAHDRLGSFTPIVELDGRLAVLRVKEVRPLLDGDRPRLLVHAQSADGQLAVDTTIELAADAPRIELATEVENLGTAPHRARIGARLRWHGEAPFAPTIGQLDHDARAWVPWVASIGSKQSYALSGAESVELGFRSDLAHRDEQVLLGGERGLEPGERVRSSRSLIVATGPLESVAELAWRAHGTRIGWVEGRLEPVPHWARVELRDSAGRVVIVARGEQGRFRAPAPPGSYEAELVVPGGSDRQSAIVAAERASRLSFIVPQAARLAYRVTDSNERLVPARFVFRGLAPTVNPDLGPYHTASGAANVAYSASGEGSIELPAGRYAVLATHGPEFSIDERVVEVTAERGATLRARLEHVVETAGWVAADLHLHAEPSSDSEVSLGDRVTTLLTEGVEVAVATDHNHATDYGPSVTALGATERLATAVGVELTTPEWGHFNAYPYPLDGPLPPVAEAAPSALFAFVRDVAPKALVQVNHPRMGGIGYFDVGKLDREALSGREGFSLDFDALEVWNGFDLAKPDTLESNFLEWMELVARGRRFTAVGNSDSHRVVYQWAGYPRTYVFVGEESTEGKLWDRVADGLRAGRVLVTSGPFVDLRVAGQRPGALVRATDGKVEVELTVLAADWIGIETADLFVDGAPTLHLDAKAPESAATADDRRRLHWVGSLPVSHDSFVVARVWSTTLLDRVLPGAGALSGAFTNPVFVDADGDGRFSAPRASASALDAGALDGTAPP